MPHELYQQDINACFSASGNTNGLDEAAYNTYVEAANKSLDSLKTKYETVDLPLLRLPEKTKDLEAIEEIAARFNESFDDVIILGTGGSSLGGQTICELAPKYNPATPNLHFMDNIDAVTFEELFQSLNPKRTGFIVISKSGGTAETLTQFLYCLDIFRNQLPAETLKNHFVIITEPGDRPLRRLAEKWEFETIDHDQGVGGRYSALSVVGLLPALIAGVDAYQIREGAAVVLQETLNGSVETSPPAQGAILNIGLAQHNDLTTTVIMPYIDKLSSFGFWYRQLWAESLGKIGNGTTPVRALGTVDQHSQLQLYLDGPHDKFFTLLMTRQAGTGGQIPAELADDTDLNFIAGKHMGDLMDAEQRATAQTLIDNNCPTRIMTLHTLNEHALGALLMHFMLETIIAADLLGIDAFDQPAVEQGKVLAVQYLQGDTPE